MLHCASIALVLKPLALVAGVVEVAGCAIGVAQIQGRICVPENTGPPIGWLLIVRYAPFFLVGLAVTTLLPLDRPVITPSTRPFARWANASLTSRPPTSTFNPEAEAPCGRTISTRASPPLTRSARLDRVLMVSESEVPWQADKPSASAAIPIRCTVSPKET